MTHAIEVTVNGVVHRGEVEARRTLADFLRHNLRLTGTHLGCEHGACGACTVLMDGEPVRSCLTLAVQANGASLETVEGLASADGALHPLQAAFRECHALQCGFCTPGFLMSALALLRQNPSPTRDEIREALSGNLCRCTGYQNIVSAVALAADAMAGRAVVAASGRSATRFVAHGGGGTLIGAPQRRAEDGRLLQGRGRYLDDLELPGALHAAVLRSPHAHARLVRVDAGAARRLPGVVAVLTAEDLGAANRPLLEAVPNPALRAARQPLLASGRVLYVGQPVAIVAATDRYVAEDAADLIVAEFEPLSPSLGGPPRAGVPPVFDVAPDNLAARIVADVGSVDRALGEADVRLTDRFVIRRGGGHAMEGRGVAATIEADGALRVWSSAQMPHVMQRALAGMLDLPLRQVRVACPDIGGGFGPKAYLYPEDVLVPLLALRLRRPVTWTEDRREHFVASTHDGEQVHEVEAGFGRDGTLVALRDRFTCAIGADLPWGIVTPLLTLQAIPGQYRLPNYHGEFSASYSNTAAVAPVRGAGRPQASIVMDLVLNRAARELGIDPAEIRSRNMIQPGQFPYSPGLVGRDGTPLTYDSGNYPDLLRRALARAGYDAFRREQVTLRAAGRFVGIGIGTCVEGTSLGPLEGATVRVDPSGMVLVLMSASSQGQSHETTMAQVCAAVLGVPFESVRVIAGRTDDLPYGTGTFSCRMGAVGGSAVFMAAGAVRERALDAAAALLEAAREDLVLEDSRVHVRGLPDRSLAIAEIARVLSGPSPGVKFAVPVDVGLEATRYFTPESPAYSAAVHVSIVEVNPKDGAVLILRHVVVHDCGRVLNPLVVEGQVHGGVAHGIGNALFEDMPWDADGQPLATSYMDYLLPSATDVPDVDVEHVETPTPLNPLGAKGAGEGGTIPCASAIAGAVEDALAPLGVLVREVPITPARLRAWIAAAQAKRTRA